MRYKLKFKANDENIRHRKLRLNNTITEFLAREYSLWIDGDLKVEYYADVEPGKELFADEAFWTVNDSEERWSFTINYLHNTISKERHSGGVISHADFTKVELKFFYELGLKLSNEHELATEQYIEEWF